LEMAKRKEKTRALKWRRYLRGVREGRPDCEKVAKNPRGEQSPKKGLEKCKQSKKKTTHKRGRTRVGKKSIYGTTTTK